MAIEQCFTHVFQQDFRAQIHQLQPHLAESERAITQTRKLIIYEHVNPLPVFTQPHSVDTEGTADCTHKYSL